MAKASHLTTFTWGYQGGLGYRGPGQGEWYLLSWAHWWASNFLVPQGQFQNLYPRRAMPLRVPSWKHCFSRLLHPPSAHCSLHISGQGKKQKPERQMGHFPRSVPWLEHSHPPTRTDFPVKRVKVRRWRAGRPKKQLNWKWLSDKFTIKSTVESIILSQSDFPLLDHGSMIR